MQPKTDHPSDETLARLRYGLKTIVDQQFREGAKPVDSLDGGRRIRQLMQTAREQSQVLYDPVNNAHAIVINARTFGTLIATVQTEAHKLLDARVPPEVARRAKVDFDAFLIRALASAGLTATIRVETAYDTDGVLNIVHLLNDASSKLEERLPDLPCGASIALGVDSSR